MSIGGSVTIGFGVDVATTSGKLTNPARHPDRSPFLVARHRAPCPNAQGTMPLPVRYIRWQVS